MIQRLSAVGANLLTYFIRSGYACRRGLPGGNGYAGSALHPQGTMSLDPYRRKTVVLLVLGDCLCCMTAGAVSTQAWRLALSGSVCACRRGLPGGNGYAGSALHPQGISPLDPVLREKNFCFGD